MAKSKARKRRDAKRAKELEARRTEMKTWPHHGPMKVGPEGIPWPDHGDFRRADPQLTDEEVIAMLQQAQALAPPPGLKLPSPRRYVVIATWATQDNEGTDYVARVAYLDDQGQLQKVVHRRGWEGGWGDGSGIARLRPFDVLHEGPAGGHYEDLGLDPVQLVTLRVSPPVR